MGKLRYSEVFYSVQGEGRFVGVPSVFLRVFGCNFECAGFGQERGNLLATDKMPYYTDPRADKNHPQAYKSIEELPVTPIGCDSSASWAMKYKHLQLTETIEEVQQRIIDLLPNGKYGEKEDIHLVITGGEPLLGWQRVWPELLELGKQLGLKNVTFETNTTQPLHKDFEDYLRKQTKFKVTWSCSPKLSVSGEPWETAIKPDIARSYFDIPNSDGYFKFVVADSTDVDEVGKAVKEYSDVGINVPVYCMPLGGRSEMYNLNTQGVARLAMERGWRYTPRLQVDIFGNKWGT